jgi:hypothetical protein
MFMGVNSKCAHQVRPPRPDTEEPGLDSAVNVGRCCAGYEGSRCEESGAIEGGAGELQRAARSEHCGLRERRYDR